MKKKDYRILAAVNSPTIMKTLRFAFPADEFKVFVFTDGSHAEEAADRIKPDAFILSLHLPVKDGYDIARRLKSRPGYKETPLVFLQGAFEPLEERKLTGLSYDQIIREPFDSESLVRGIRKKIVTGKQPSVLPEDSDMGSPLPEENAKNVTQGEEDPETGRDSLFEPLEKYEKAVFSKEKIREEVRNEFQYLVEGLEERMADRIWDIIEKRLHGKNPDGYTSKKDG